MIAAQSLSLVKPREAEPGTLLIREVGGVDGLALTTSVHDMGRDVPSYVEIVELAQWSAVLRAAGANENNWMAINNWQIRVDPASSYTSHQAMPAPGDAFMFGAAVGIVARFANTVGYVTTDGAHLHQPEWQFFAGFRQWQIVHWPEHGAEPIVLYDRGAAQDAQA